MLKFTRQKHKHLHLGKLEVPKLNFEIIALIAVATIAPIYSIYLVHK